MSLFSLYHVSLCELQWSPQAAGIHFKILKLRMAWINSPLLLQAFHANQSKAYKTSYESDHLKCLGALFLLISPDAEEVFIMLRANLIVACSLPLFFILSHFPKTHYSPDKNRHLESTLTDVENVLPESKKYPLAWKVQLWYGQLWGEVSTVVVITMLWKAYISQVVSRTAIESQTPHFLAQRSVAKGIVPIITLS